MSTKSITLSLSSILLIFLLIVCIGIFGGYIGSRIFEKPLPLISDTTKTIVPVSQQITISPSKSSEDIVATHRKSVFLIAEETSKGTIPLGIGTALTNDGVIITTVQATSPKDQLIAIGDDNTAAPLTPAGEDVLSGLTLYKITDRIIAPIDVAQNSLRVGASLLALYRQQETAQISSTNALFAAPIFPSLPHAPGVQQVGQFTISDTSLPGAPLLDENGKLTGIVIDPEKKTALLASDIRAVLDRLSSNTLANNPFASFGFTVAWNGVFAADRTIKIQATVASVTPSTPASAAGLKVGDTITAIDGNTVSWDTNMYTALSSKPLQVTILRQDQQRVLTITP